MKEADRNISTTSFFSVDTQISAGEGEVAEETDGKDEEKMEAKEQEVRRGSKRSESDSEDEFYECQGDDEILEGDGEEEGGAKETSKDEGEKGADARTETPEDEEEEKTLKPEGRLKVCGNLKLLHSDEDLYIPITQVRDLKAHN